jgi:isopentenyl diphosphate isomerase/L-lactate dehydrogenase-like FMN-dependent dehydrogenase
MPSHGTTGPKPALTVRDLSWLRETWSGSLIVKGIQQRR